GRRRGVSDVGSAGVPGARGGRGKGGLWIALKSGRNCESVAIISRYFPPRFRRSISAPRFLERLKKSQTVAGGPFKGMLYEGQAICGAAAPKIMGVYESELAPFLLKWSVIPFRHIINVGAGEGY